LLVMNICKSSRKSLKDHLKNFRFVKILLFENSPVYFSCVGITFFVCFCSCIGWLPGMCSTGETVDHGNERG
jgi:hypothetical protein